MGLRCATILCSSNGFKSYKRVFAEYSFIRIFHRKIVVIRFSEKKFLEFDNTYTRQFWKSGAKFPRLCRPIFAPMRLFSY